MASPSADVYIHVEPHLITETYRGDASAPQLADNSDADSDSHRGVLPVVYYFIGYNLFSYQAITTETLLAS